jgi:hypothetical protein
MGAALARRGARSASSGLGGVRTARDLGVAVGKRPTTQRREGVRM